MTLPIMLAVPLLKAAATSGVSATFIIEMVGCFLGGVGITLGVGWYASPWKTEPLNIKSSPLGQIEKKSEGDLVNLNDNLAFLNKVPESIRDISEALNSNQHEIAQFCHLIKEFMASSPKTLNDLIALLEAISHRKLLEKDSIGSMIQVLQEFRLSTQHEQELLLERKQLIETVETYKLRMKEFDLVNTKLLQIIEVLEQKFSKQMGVSEHTTPMLGRSA
jgi:hypothetical protein